MLEEISFYDSIYPAHALVKEFGVGQSEAMKAIDQEANDIQERIPRTRDNAAIEQSYNRVRAWILEAEEYMVKLEWGDIAQFASSHRPACVWAVLIGKALGIRRIGPGVRDSAVIEDGGGMK